MASGAELVEGLLQPLETGQDCAGCVALALAKAAVEDLEAVLQWEGMDTELAVAWFWVHLATFYLPYWEGGQIAGSRKGCKNKGWRTIKQSILVLWY